jgi:hypothetical protein
MKISDGYRYRYGILPLGYSVWGCCFDTGNLKTAAGKSQLVKLRVAADRRFDKNAAVLDKSVIVCGRNSD